MPCLETILRNMYLKEDHMSGKSVIVMGKKGVVANKTGSDGDTSNDEIYNVRFEDGSISNHPVRDMQMIGESTLLNEMDPKEHVRLNKATGMYCVYNKDGEKVKEFKDKADADKWATDNHDSLMEEARAFDNKNEAKRMAYKLAKRTGEGHTVLEVFHSAGGQGKLFQVVSDTASDEWNRKMNTRTVLRTAYNESVELDESGDPRIAKLSFKAKEILANMANSLDTTGGPYLDKRNVKSLTRRGVEDTLKAASRIPKGNKRAAQDLAILKKELAESVELDERTSGPTRMAVDKEFTNLTRSGRMDTMSAIKRVERMFKVKNVKVAKDKNGKPYVISFDERQTIRQRNESVELDEAIRLDSSRIKKFSTPASPKIRQWIESGKQKYIINVASALGETARFVVVETPRSMKSGDPAIADKVMMFTIDEPKRGKVKMVAFHGTHVSHQKAMDFAANRKLIALKDKSGKRLHSKYESVELGESTPAYTKMMKAYKGSDMKKVFDILKKKGFRGGPQGDTLVNNMLKKNRGNVQKAAAEIEKKYPKLFEETQLDEAVKTMDKKAALNVYNKLKKGSKVAVEFGGAMSSTNTKPIELVVTSPHRVVGKSKVGRIILKNPTNPRGVKYTLFNRDGSVTLAQGDMGTILKDMKISENVEHDLDEAGRYTYGEKGDGPAGMKISKGREEYLKSREGQASLKRRKEQDARRGVKDHVEHDLDEASRPMGFPGAMVRGKIKGKFTKAQLDQLRDAYAKIGRVDPSSKTYEKLTAFLDAQDANVLKQLANARIQFISSLALNRVNRLKMKGS